MKLHHLRDLLAIVEKGSINAAAKHLAMAQPALSRSIRELEKDLGVPLLQRHATGSILTETGLLFVRRASVVMSELRKAREEIGQLGGAVHGKVVACVSSVSHIALLSEALAPFNAAFPHVQLRVIEGVYPTAEARLKNGEIDFYVGAAPLQSPPPELQVTKLFENRRVVLARRGHPLGKSRTLADLVNANWVTNSITEQPEAELTDLFALHELPPPKLALQGQSALTWITAVVHADMLVLQPIQWGQSPVVSALVAPLPIRELLPAPDMVLIRRAATPLTPAAEHLCNLLRRPAERLQREMEKSSPRQ